MNYSDMSDFEINCAVAKAMGMNVTQGISFVGAPIGGETLRWVKNNNTDERFDPCNSWADAGPIIQESGISLYHSNGNWEAEFEYSAPVGGFGTDETCSKFISDKSPLRAVCIVFLMMKEADNAN